MATLRYEVVLTEEARSDLLDLRASDRAKVVDALRTFLESEPTKTSKSRIKRLCGYDSPQYRLRIDDIRVFYDVEYVVDAAQGTVMILAIKKKEAGMTWLEKFGQRGDDETGSLEKS